MTVSLKVGVRHLLPEFLADALVFLGPLETAGAVAAGALQTIFNHSDNLLVLVQTNCHDFHILSRKFYTPVWFLSSLG